MKQLNWTNILVAFIVTLLSHFLPHSWGWTPAVAIGTVLSYFYGYRILIPIRLAHLCSDLFFGMYDAFAMIGTYCGYLSAAAFGLIVKKGDVLSYFANGLMGSIAFFSLSNFGVWLTPYYEHTLNGMAQCYTAAIPFWRGQFVSDLLLVSATALMFFWKPKFASSTLKTRKAGFTLIELLVVITIIAILASILFPVFTSAKASAKKIQSISSLKQINMASLMYSTDNDGILMRDHIDSGMKTVYWWGSWDGISLKPEESFLYPYTKNKGINNDSVMPDSFRNALGMTGYGYNYAYLSPTIYDSNWNETLVSVSDTQSSSPAETISFATSARINNWAYSPWKLEGSALIDPPSYQFPGVHARHVGNKAVVSWLDGHVTTMSVSVRSQNFGYSFNPSWYTKSRLGDIMNANCAYDSPCEDYFYDLN